MWHTIQSTKRLLRVERRNLHEGVVDGHRRGVDAQVGGQGQRLGHLNWLGTSINADHNVALWLEWVSWAAVGCDGTRTHHRLGHLDPEVAQSTKPDYTDGLETV